MMNIVKLNPWNDMMNLRHNINRMFDESFYPEKDKADTSALCHWRPKVDIYETETSFVVNAELPGVEKKDIEIDYKDGVLTLKGERAYNNEVKEEKFYKREMSVGKFQRSFAIAESVDVEKIKADYKDGVLKVTIPKPEEKKAKQITVN